MKNKIPILIFTFYLMLSFGSVDQISAYNHTDCLEHTKTKLFSKDFSGGFIIGKIDESIKDLSGNRKQSKPMSSIQIKAEQIDGDKRAYYETTTENGSYEMKVPIGEYIVTLTDSNLYFGEQTNNKPIKLKKKQCKVKDFFVVNDSRIKGKAIDSFGNPVTDISIALIRTDRNRNDKNFEYEISQTRSRGNFTFTGLSPGFYQISLNYIENPDLDSPYPTFFYPYTKNRNEAQIIEINYGTKIKDLVFQLPPKLKKRRVVGTVLWKNGKPAKNAEVQLTDVEFNDSVFFRTKLANSRGEFEIDWIEGRKYKISVIVWENFPDGSGSFGIADAESEVFTLDEKTPKFKIVLKKINPKEKTITSSVRRADK